jgi:hypothetical protein
MGELVNLRRIRKRRSKDEAERTAAANRSAFGIRKDERRRNELERAAVRRTIDAHRLEGPRDDAD